MIILNLFGVLGLGIFSALIIHLIYQNAGKLITLFFISSCLLLITTSTIAAAKWGVLAAIGAFVLSFVACYAALTFIIHLGGGDAP